MKTNGVDRDPRGLKVEKDVDARYPLIESRADELSAGSGRRLADVTTAAALEGALRADDLQIDSATLRTQAEIAAEAGYSQLAENLMRAAELTRVPNEELLQMYEALRPGRSSSAELEALAQRLDETFDAPITAAFVREASQVYARRSLLRRRPGEGSNRGE